MATNPSGFVGAASIGSVPVAVSGTPAAGSVLAGTSGTAAQWGAAPAASSPGAPATTTSVTQVMMGLAASFTASGSGRVLVTCTATVRTQTAQTTVTVGGRFGTGTAPVNGAAVTGTVFGPAADPVIQGSGAGSFTTFAVSDVLVLTPGQANWFDLAIATGNVADAAGAANVKFTFVEV
jgi:hypothetical protein